MIDLRRILGTLSLIASAPLFAASTYQLNIESQSLSTALQQFAKQSGLQVVYYGKVAAGLNATGVKGTLTAEEALNRLLQGTELQFETLDPYTVAISSTKEAPGEKAKKTAAASEAVHHANTIRLAQADPNASAQGASKSSDSDNAENHSESTSNRTESGGLEEVVVTGSHIRGALPAGSPIVVIDRAEIDRSGYSSAREIVEALPQNYGMGPTEESSSAQSLGTQGSSLNSTFGSSLNLRGLGPLATLTLINGRRAARSGRAGSFFDVSVVPFAAIERVEVLTDGASSIYGSDAIGGVVNFILRDRFVGGDTSIRFGSVTDGDMAEYQLSHAQGFGWASGSLLATVEYSSRDNLAAADRPVYSFDLRPYGGPDLRAQSCNPGNIVGGGQVFGIPQGQDGTTLTPGQLLPGAPNLCDRREGTDALPEQERISTFLTAKQELTAGVRLFGEVMYSRRRFDLAVPANEQPQILTVPTTNPWYLNPFGGPDQPVQVAYSFLQDIGAQVERGHATVRSATLGTDFDLPARWAGELYATYSDSEDRLIRDNAVNTFYLDAALANSDPAQAFNPFGDGSHTNAAVLDAIGGYNRFREKYEMREGGVKFDGPLFELPGGSARLAIGAEYRREATRYEGLRFVSSEFPVADVPVSSARNIKAAFAELSLPLIGPQNARAGVRDLVLSISGRYEDYSDFGQTRDPRIGLAWTPVQGLKVRGSYGTSFRAPTLDDVRADSAASAYFNFPLPNPAGGVTSTILLLGRNPELQPEEGRTWSAGVDFAPVSHPNVKAGLTYFSIDYTDKISDLSVYIFQSLLDPALASVVQLNPTQAQVDALVASQFFYSAPPAPGSVGAIADLRISNLAQEKQRGLDLDLGYDFDSRFGRWSTGTSATYVFKDEQNISAASPGVEVNGTIVGPVDLRLRGRLLWNRGPLGAALFLNYIDSYRNTNVLPVADVASWTTFDLNLQYTAPEASTWLSGVQVSANVRNLFDRGPPIAISTNNGFYPLAFDPQNANALGRFVSLRLRKQW